MKALSTTLLLVLLAASAAAQQRVEIFFDAEGVRRSGSASKFTTGTRFEPQFRTGGGVGGGLNFFFSDRVSLEAKVAALATKVRVRIIGSDFIGTADLGWAQLYPISAVVRWHLRGGGAARAETG